MREQWNQIEGLVEEFSGWLRARINLESKAAKDDPSERMQRILKFKKKMDSKEEREVFKEDFLNWGKDYVEKLKSKVDNQKASELKENFFVLIRNFGINDQLLRETFANNKKELLDPVVGEAIAILALVLGWSKKDKEAFSQALGEIGVAGIFAAKPFILLIAICGLAYGYNRSFHKEAFKKGGVLGLAGMTAALIAPGTFVGILAAIVTMVYFNRKLSVDKPIETQLKEIFRQVRSGEFFGEVRQSWKRLEEFLGQLVSKESPVS